MFCYLARAFVYFQTIGWPMALQLVSLALRRRSPLQGIRLLSVSTRMAAPAPKVAVVRCHPCATSCNIFCVSRVVLQMAKTPVELRATQGVSELSKFHAGLALEPQQTAGFESFLVRLVDCILSFACCRSDPPPSFYV